MTTSVDRNTAFATGIREIATEVAAPAAAAVDSEARFPEEAVSALRELSAFSAYVPPEHGGGGVAFHELATACFDLGRACAATGMVFAMHQIQVASIARHLDGEPFFAGYLDELVAQQRLIASATSETGIGGDLRKSIAALAEDGDELRFEKHCSTVSYGAHADDLLTTVRRHPDADAADQVLVLTRRADVELEQTTSWDPLGMRGTCSPGFTQRARVTPDHVLITPFSQIAAETMVPFSHLLWAHVWLGIATSAYDRARAFVRAQAGGASTLPPSATRLSAVAGDLHGFRAELGAATDEYAALVESDERRDTLHTMGYAIRINTLKITASERAPRICAGALAICGMAGYKNDTQYSVGRQLRDALSAALMIGNDRLHATNAGLLLLHKGT